MCMNMDELFDVEPVFKALTSFPIKDLLRESDTHRINISSRSEPAADPENVCVNRKMERLARTQMFPL